MEKQDYDIAREEATAFLNEKNLDCNIYYKGASMHDASVMLDWGLTCKGIHFSYSMGIGHIDWKKAEMYCVNIIANLWYVVRAVNTHRIKHGNDLIAACNTLQKNGFAKQPTVVDVLCCYASDAKMGEQTFSDFCRDLDYDEDSRKAFDIYLSCQNAQKELLKIGLSRADIDTLAEFQYRF